MSTIVVVWALMVAPAGGRDLLPAASHYYWTEPACEIAAARMAEQIAAPAADGASSGGRSSFALQCVPFMRERASSGWLQANVIGPCEPRYDDCGGLDRTEFEAMVASARRWKVLMGDDDDAGQSGHPPSPPRWTSAERIARFERMVTQGTD